LREQLQIRSSNLLSEGIVHSILGIALHAFVDFYVPILCFTYDLLEQAKDCW
jgi:hypothetical protein